MYGFFFNDHPDITALVDWALNTNLLTNSFNAGPRWGESEVKTEIAYTYSLSQLWLLCSTYIQF